MSAINQLQQECVRFLRRTYTPYFDCDLTDQNSGQMNLLIFYCPIRYKYHMRERIPVFKPLWRKLRFHSLGIFYSCAKRLTNENLWYKVEYELQSIRRIFYDVATITIHDNSC